MQTPSSTLVVLGTGGTIAGTAAQPSDTVGYTAAQLGVAQLVAAVPTLAAAPLECEQVAQLDSKDMDHATWQRLAERAAHHLARDAVAGIVVTHGTDTMEETAYFLHRVLAPAKPVVLTGAMRPATSLQADGPQNLLDALTLAAMPAARGVLAVMGGQVFAGAELRKLHPYRLDAFGAGDAGALGVVALGRVRRLRPWPEGQALGLGLWPGPGQAWPWVEVVTSHADARAEVVDVLCAAGVQGLVVAGTGNATVHRALDAALARAQAAGVAVWRASRCAAGETVAPMQAAAPEPALTVAQARVELMLRLLVQGQRPAATS